MRRMETVVKVTRGISTSEKPAPPALVHKKGGAHPEHHYLSPEIEAQMGDAIIAYYTAERIGGRWSLIEKLPDNPQRGW